MHRFRPGRLLPTAVALIGVTALATGATAGPGHDTASRNPLTASSAPRATAGPASASFAPAVGALFQPDSASHFCTAAVIDSPHGNVVLTAAHCLADTGVGLRFVPGYGPSGTGPAGSWTVTGAYADPEWLAEQDIRHDYALLTVAPADGAPNGRGVQAVVGAVGRLSPSVAGDQEVSLFGYTAGSHDLQVTCATRITSTPDDDGGSPTVACPGFRGGTSGSPWIQQGPGGPQVVGLVGGLHQGGCTDDVSLSPALDPTVMAVLARAAAASPPDAFPVPDDDGC